MTPLLEAWKAWDRHPAVRDRTTRYDEACAELGTQLGLTATEVRGQLAEKRRAGLPRSGCVAALEGSITDGEPGATADLNRMAQHLRRHHHDLYERIRWPWSHEASDQ